MQESCIFCKIIEKQVPAAIVLENTDVLVIRDINPKAPVHYLIIPKKHIVDLQSVNEKDEILIAKTLSVTKELSKQLPSYSFRLISNNGKESGQSVFHLHFHFLSGKQMHDF